MNLNASHTRYSDQMGLFDRVFQISWSYLFFITLIAVIGYVALYSAASGNIEPWALSHAIRFSVGVVGLLVVALIDLKLWHRYAYWIYAIGLCLLLAVEIKGFVGMGPQRWINLGFINLQPSEIMKICVVIALARYFNGVTVEDIRNPKTLIIPLILVLLPTALVMTQPDLGTALMILMVAGAIFFLAGVSYWLFGIVLAGGVACIPVAWHFMQDYQKRRVLTFLNPESDPLGSGYHITQSKIALGSGGISGKGFLEGTQSHLNFLPEKQTDFIFTLMAEEWGFIGSCAIGRLLALGITMNFLLYVFINISMVTGLIPVVGVPLPMISNGGSAMMAALFGFGLIMCVYVHRDYKFGKR
jgi:rod shape determining protein RodA